MGQLHTISAFWSFGIDDPEDWRTVTIETSLNWPDAADRFADIVLDEHIDMNCHHDEWPEKFYIRSPSGDIFGFYIETEYEPSHTARRLPNAGLTRPADDAAQPGPGVTGSGQAPCSTACANCNGDRWIECDSSHGMPPGVGYPCADCNSRGELKYREPIPSNRELTRPAVSDARAVQEPVAGSASSGVVGCEPSNGETK